MTKPDCPTHGQQCAYTGAEPELCPACHAPFDKITKPASYVAASGVSKKTDEPWQELGYTGGYGETREEHASRHAAKAAADAERNRRRGQRAQPNQPTLEGATP